MRATLLTIGDELLIGQVVNTNAAWLGEQMSRAGIDLDTVVTVGDDEGAIRRALADGLERGDFVLLTGGLGPTHDDLTREAVAAHFGVSLTLNASVVAAIEARFVARGRTMPERNKVQAMVPEGFTVLPNPVGTAPGLWWSGTIQGAKKYIGILPGVPYEMRYLSEHELLPRLVSAGGLRVIRHRSILTTGVGESHLQEMLGDMRPFFEAGLRLAYLPGTSGVRLRITGAGHDADELDAKMASFEAHIRECVERHIYGIDGDSLEGAVGDLLTRQGLTISVAESCTGGYVLNRLTNISGSSDYVVGGVVAYHNEVKMELLGVDREALKSEGAVSEVVARRMAEGIRKHLNTDIGVSTTGIAGPTGGTPDKPVGTVWVGYADQHGAKARLFQFGTDRVLNKELFSTATLGYIWRCVRAHLQ